MPRMVQSPTRARVRRRSARHDESELSASDSTGLLALQRLRGNQHVQRALSGATEQTDLQRAPKAQPKATAAEEAMLVGAAPYAPKESLVLWKLSGRQTFSLNPSRINLEAQSLIDRVNNLAPASSSWQAKLDVLGQHTGDGKGKLEAVKSAAGKIGSSATGQRGAYNRGSVENYLRATVAVEQAYAAMLPLQKEVDGAVSKINELKIEGRKKKAQAVADQAAKEVADEKERIATEKKYLTKALNLAKVVVDPTEWVGTVVDVVTFVGEEIIDKKYTSSYLGILEKQLAEAQAEVSAIDDLLVLQQMNTAATALEKAGIQLTNARKVFDNSVKEAKLQETTIVETLKGDKATKGAADAVVEREMVAGTARDAGKEIDAWLGNAAKAQVNAQWLDKIYDRVLIDLAEDNSSTARNEQEATQTQYFATENAREIREVTNWLNITVEEGRDSLEYIAEGSYFAGYDAIPEALRTALINRNNPNPKAKKQ